MQSSAILNSQYTHAMISRFYRIVFTMLSLNIIVMSWWKLRHSKSTTLLNFKMAATSTTSLDHQTHFGIERNTKQSPQYQSEYQGSHHVLCATHQQYHSNTELQDSRHTNTSNSTIITDSTYHHLILKRPFFPLTNEVANNVQRFVFFVGYARSGHSIIASMMDAHPNMIIAHEYRLFHKLSNSKIHLSNQTDLFNELYRNSYTNALSGWRSDLKGQKGYTLSVNNAWQGVFSRLQVIGDKSGGATAQLFKNSPSLYMSALSKLRNIVNVPIRVIHVVRSPYDMISTRLLYTDASSLSKSKLKSKLAATETCKHSNITGLQNQINRTFHIIENVQQIFDVSNLTVLDVHLVDFIKNPRRVLEMICNYLSVECSDEYIESCVHKVYKEQSKTRRLVEWPQEMIEEVEERAKPYQFLWRYSFSGD